MSNFIPFLYSKAGVLLVRAAAFVWREKRARLGEGGVVIIGGLGVFFLCGTQPVTYGVDMGQKGI